MIVARERALLAAVLVALSALALIPSTGAASSRGYTVTDLGTLGGTTSAAYAINKGGDIVGVSDLSGDSASHAFLYHDGALADLGTLSGGTNSRANAIDDDGQIAGTSQELISSWSGCSACPAVGWRAFRYSAGTMSDLGGRPGYSYPYLPPQSFAFGINESGDVVGSALTPSQDLTAFLFPASGAASPIPGAVEAYDINNSGQVVGTTSQFSLGPAFVTSTGGALVTFGSADGSTAFAIDKSGEVTGSSRFPVTGFGPRHAFLFSGSTLSDLGTLGGSTSVGYAINDHGDVVGSSATSGDTATHAFVYTDGHMQDLNSLIAPASGWVLQEARGVNKSGQIVGFGTIGGNQHAFLLDPSHGAQSRLALILPRS